MTDLEAFMVTVHVVSPTVSHSLQPMKLDRLAAGANRPPPLPRPVPQERAAVSPPPASDSDGAGDVDHPHGGARTRGGPVAELPLEVPPPALHCAVPQQRTGVLPPGGDGDGTGDAAHPHGRGRDCPGSARAELPVGVLSPTVHRAIPQ